MSSELESDRMRVASYSIRSAKKPSLTVTVKNIKLFTADLIGVL